MLRLPKAEGSRARRPESEGATRQRHAQQILVQAVDGPRPFALEPLGSLVYPGQCSADKNILVTTSPPRPLFTEDNAIDASINPSA
jgi:hypothetical protein